MDGSRLRTARRRQWVVFLVFVLFGAKLAWSLVDIQVLSHTSYLDAAQRQQKKRVVIAPRRGTIYDRNGVALAGNVERYQLYLVPRSIEDVDRFIRDFTAIVPHDESDLRAKIAQGGWYVRLPLDIPRETVRKLEAAGIAGVGVETGLARHYPYGDLAGDLLGRVDVDNVGIEGLELQYDDALRGRPGYAVHQRDALGREYPNFTYPVQAPVHGRDVYLTIDLAIQENAEAALDEAVRKTHARSASMVVVDPRTGEILALANAVGRGAPATRRDVQRNYAVVDEFEPGSTFKVVTLAGLYEDSLAAPADSLFCENGTWNYNGRILRDVHPYGWLSVEQVIEESSNICAAKLAQRLGNDRLYDFARRFGFGLPSGIDFPGEPRGVLKRTEQWSELTPASMAMGYEVMVTSLQMAMAYASIANGGELMRPYLVRRVAGEDGEVAFEGRPQRVRSVVRPETARLITLALIRVVESGTARTAHIDVLPVAGKTGTTRKTSAGGGYANGLYTSTFVGFFPANEPRYVAFVRVDEPVGAFYGGAVAAPVFRQTVERGLVTRTLARSPDLVQEMRSPGRVVWTASETFGELEPPVDSLASPGSGEAAWAAPGAMADAPEELDSEAIEPYVVDVVGTGRPGEVPYDPREQVKVPDLVGLSLREAVTRASRLGIRLAFSGTGRVTAQAPEPGEVVARGEIVRVANR